MSCTKRTLGLVPAAPGWIAYYVSSRSTPANYELANMPVAYFIVRDCTEHGREDEAVVVTTKGTCVEATQPFITADGTTLFFLAMVAPHQAAESVIQMALEEHRKRITGEIAPTAPAEN